MFARETGVFVAGRSSKGVSASARFEWYITPLLFPRDRDASQGAVASWLRRVVGAVAAACACCRRGRSEQGHPLVLSHRRERVRPGPDLRSLFGDDQRGDFRAAADLRLSRAAVEGRADGRRSDARSHRRRQDLHVQDHARASISRPIPRSRARSASSPPRTSSIRTCGSWIRRTARRTRFCSRARSSAWTSSPRRRRRPASSTTTPRSRAWRRSTDTRCASGSKETDYNFLYIAAHTSLGAVAREVIEAYGDDTMGHPGRHRPVPAEELEAALQDRARSQSRISRLRLGLPADGRPVGQGALRDDEGQADAAGRPRRDQRSSRRPSRAGSRSSRRKSTT